MRVTEKQLMLLVDILKATLEQRDLPSIIDQESRKRLYVDIINIQANNIIEIGNPEDIIRQNKEKEDSNDPFKLG